MRQSVRGAVTTLVRIHVLPCLVLLGAGLTASTSDLFAQSKFLFGMYAIGWGENEGITWNGSGYGMRTGPGGTRLMTFWNDSLGMNTFFIINSNFPEGGEDNAPYVNYLYKTYAAYPTASRNFIRESKIIPIYCCHQITRAAESHYLKFSPATREAGNSIDFDTSVFKVVAGDTSYTVSSTAARNAAPLIRGLTVRGGEMLQLRPRDWNTRGKAAFFKLRFRFYSPRVGNTLSVSLTNSSSGPGRGNYQLVNSNVAITAGHSEVVFPFTLDLQNAIYEAYVCRLGLNVRCSMPSGGAFQIKDVTAYDDSGRVVVEEPARFYNTRERRALDKAFSDIAAGIAGSSYAPKVFPIIALADEPHIGNYAPMEAVCRHLLQVDNRLTFYSTWPNDDLLHTNRETVIRFARIPLHYVAANHYMFRKDILDHRRSLFRDYEVLANFCATLRTVDSTKSIISVPPLFTGGDELRAPTQWEILGSAYLSILVGAKGVVYYYGGPFHEQEQPLYSYHDMEGPPQRMFTLKNMHAYKVAALKTFASFVNKNSGESGGLSNGSLLSTYGVDKYAIVGTSNGRDDVNARAFAANQLGNRTKAEITDITLVDGAGRTLTNSTMIGVAHLADKASTPNTTYFLITNLHSSDTDVRMKLAFRSTHARSYLRVNNITYSGDLTNISLPRTGTVTTTLPAHGAMILKVENTNTQ